MPSQEEVRVMRILSAVELNGSVAQSIEDMGTAAVTVVCEAALGSYPGLRPKVRHNAVALLGYMSHPQALETVRLLVSHSAEGVSTRALRAAARQKNAAVVDNISLLLEKPETPALIAAEAVKALRAIDSPPAQAALASYASASGEALPHRISGAVRGVLERP
jgi:hypothetical protein